jgi:hypothetical protein
MATSKNITSLLNGQYNAQNYYLTVNAIAEQLSALSSAVEDALLNTPPTPTEGYTYIVGTSPTGDWVSQNNKIAHYYNGSWHFYIPFRGAILYSINDSNWYLYNGTNWIVV